MEQYVGTAYTIKALLELLAKVPDTAYTNLASVLGCGTYSYVEVWYDKETNTVIFK